MPGSGEDSPGPGARAVRCQQSGTGYRPGQHLFHLDFLLLSRLDVHLVVGDGLPLGLEVVIAAGLVNTQRGVERLEGEVLILLLPGHAGVDGVQVGGVFGVHGGAHETHPGEIELAEARAGHVTSIAHL